MKKQLTVENSGFNMTQKIEITGEEFTLFDIALSDGLNTRLEQVFPLAFNYIDQDGEPVENPTEEQLQSGNIRKILDVFNTFNPNNIIEGYTNVTPMMIEGIRKKYDIHHREALAGRTTPKEILMAEMNAKLEVLKAEKK